MHSPTGEQENNIDRENGSISDNKPSLFAGNSFNENNSLEKV